MHSEHGKLHLDPERNISDKLISNLDDIREHERDPIAIIGIGCRLPGGANSPEAFWHLLRDGVDAITEVPEDRWNLRAFYDPDPAKPGKTYTRSGGFIEGVDRFDAQFFGMSPREASRADPQQRVLMEVAYEAVEDAGLAPERLAGTKSGVFIGIAAVDYVAIQASSPERRSINAYTNLGMAMCIAANRISYLFDLHGPSLAVDTACSSSLVATHLACQSIWNQECELALAGGVNVILRPEGTIGFSKASMLAPDGRCKSFDARANGYVRSEGAGIVVLKPLSRAQADGDPVYAVIRGTAVNQDGRTAGISVPNRVAQEAMLREAYRQAGVSPEDVQYVEAHGTGTPVGDPIELSAIGHVVSQHRSRGDECIVGSVKTNIGHLEVASGIAGLIKAALSLQHRQIPPNLHFETPNPEIPFDSLRLRVPISLQSWPGVNSAPRLAGVNSFGFGGTNAHVVLAEAPEAARTEPRQDTSSDNRALLLPLSARSPEALQASARSYLAFLGNEASSADISLQDICYTSSVRRGHHDHRLALVTSSRAELAEQLQAFLAEETRPYMTAGRQLPNRSHKVAFVFSGMGPQWWGMGRQLLAEEPVFREVVKQCDALLRRYANLSLLKLATAASQSHIDETYIAQPAGFVLQVALAALWRSWGVEPDVIVGHSVGEVAAAHVAGVLSLEDAIRLIFHRSRLQQQAAGQGAMLAIGLPEQEAERLLVGYEERVSIAAINSPGDVTLSGDTAALQEIASALGRDLVFNRFLQVEVPYHSPSMEPLRADLLHSLQGIRPQPATIPLCSTVTGRLVEGPELDATYWWQNMRMPVRFAAAVDALARSGHNLFLEISAHPVLASSVSKCLAEAQHEGTTLVSLRRQEPERAMLLSSLGKLYTLGYPVDWKRQHPHGGRLVRLPSYPWQRESFWQESKASRQERLGTTVHPLLGNRLDAAYTVWNVELDKQALAYLDDHRIQDTVMYPAAAYVEMALAAAEEEWGPGPCVVEDIALQRAIFLSDGQPLPVQLIRDPGQASFDIYSRAHGPEQAWARHAIGKLRRFEDGAAGEQVVLGELRNRCSHEIPKSDLYRQFDKLGMRYGPCFQGVERLWIGDGEALGQIQVAAALEADLHDYRLHPAILDACLQVLQGVTMSEGANERQTEDVYLPSQIDRVRFYNRPGHTLYSHARLVEQAATHIKADFQLLDDGGNVLADVQGLVCRSIDRTREKSDNYLYEYQWKLKARPDQTFVRRSASYFPSPLQIVERLQPEAIRLAGRLNRRQYYGDFHPKVDILARAYILDALQKLGWGIHPHQRISADTLAVQLGVVPQHRRLLGRLLEILAEDNILRQTDEQWEVCCVPEVTDPEQIWKALWTQFPAYLAELTLIRQCGEKLADVLRGELDPLELIFPQGSVALTEHFYQDAPTYRIYNLLAHKALASALEHLPEGRTVRILEIGGGTGGMTAYVLRKLPVNRTEYVFTDVTQLFVTHAEQKFRQYPFMQYQLLDIEKDPIAQGFEPHSFDIVLASDVLHATRDLRQTLSNIQRLLASEGLLVFLEVTRPSRLATLVFGLLKGWWRFTDVDVRGSDPCISEGAWRHVLRDAGFIDVAGVTDTHDANEAVHSVMLARGPVVEPARQNGEVASRSMQVAGAWLIFADSKGVGQQLAGRLTEHGATPILVSAGASYQRLEATRFQVRPGQLHDMQQLLEEVLASQAPLQGVIHLWSLDAPETLTSSALESAQVLGPVNVLHLVQVLATMNGNASPPLWLVTSGTQVAGESATSVSIAQAPLWGLGRVIANEHPQLRCKLIDLSSASSPKEMRALFQELWADDQEDETVLRGEARYVHRLKRGPLLDVEAIAQEQAASGAHQPFVVEISRPGILDNLVPRAVARRKPGPGEVEIEVHAVGLNFKDVMLAMGLLPDEAVEGGYTGKTLGMECAGRIVRVGASVEGFTEGDEIIACTPGTLRTHLTIDTRFVVHKPAHLGFEEAATILTTFLTASYSLQYLARMRAGDRVLIHAAAGGVGLAAIQLAQRAGAEVFATAGTPAKRDLLRALGVKYVMDSRSLAFADEVMQYTGGRGVDIVLNSLAGEAISKSLEILSPYGRFVEIGKRDIYEDSKVGLRPFRKNLSLIAVDLDRLCADRPELVRSLLDDVLQGFEDGTLHPLPHRVFPIAEVVSAFRYMAQARHIGKVVVSMHEPEVVVAPGPQEPMIVRADGTYLIVGGLGGFGLAAAQWLVEQGARHLVLMGRSGASSPAAVVAIEAMREANVDVVVARADVTEAEQVTGVLGDIDRSMPPLRGVIHAAMVLDDALLIHLNQERMRNVMAPKVIGAWNLHTQTLDMPLDFFVSFSSFTSIIGTPGQGNYAAANAFLDALAHYRRAHGLPALTVNWGAVADAGYVSQNPDVGRTLEHIGLKSLPAQRLLRILGDEIQHRAVQVAVAHLDWPQLAKAHVIHVSRRFAHLIEASLGDDGEGQGASLVDAIMAVAPGERRQFLTAQLRDEVAKVLGTSSPKLDVEQPLLDLGLDSLMAVETGNRIQAMVGVDVPTMKLLEGISIAGLAAFVLEQLSQTSAPAPAPKLSGQETAEQLLERVDPLSEEEVDAPLLRI